MLLNFPKFITYYKKLFFPYCWKILVLRFLLLSERDLSLPVTASMRTFGRSFIDPLSYLNEERKIFIYTILCTKAVNPNHS